MDSRCLLSFLLVPGTIVQAVQHSTRTVYNSLIDTCTTNTRAQCASVVAAGGPASTAELVVVGVLPFIFEVG